MVNNPQDSHVLHAGDLYTQAIRDQILTLKTVRIQNMDFDDSHAQHLAFHITKNPNHLQTVQFYKCPSLGARGIDCFCRALLSNSSSSSSSMPPHQHMIQRLDIASVAIGDQGLLAIASLLESSNLQWLSLEDIGHDIKMTSWKTFFQAAFVAANQHQQHLKSLDLTRNNLTGDHMMDLSMSLRQNTTLETLILSRNPIGDAGVAFLSEALLVHHDDSSLSLLALGDCAITDIGLSSLVPCLRTNTTLEKIYLYANHHIDNNSQDKKELTYWLDLNSQGRRFLQSTEECLPSLVPISLTTTTAATTRRRN
jgi:hypothetical protein